MLTLWLVTAVDASWASCSCACLACVASLVFLWPQLTLPTIQHCLVLLWLSFCFDKLGVSLLAHHATYMQSTTTRASQSGLFGTQLVYQALSIGAYRPTKC